MRVSKYVVAIALTLTPIFPAWAANSTTTTTVATTHSVVHQVNTRLRNQWTLIQQGLKNGKITKDQAASLRADLRSARQQEISFFKQNGNHDLTGTQQSQLNSLLDKNSSALGETVPAGK